ncbi:MAG: PA0069 family radical SAM protein [Gammaproteobacteria bacterium]|nr:PA0069 family radical SAM protein [Gammaproteobacteria bacterium]
MNTKKDKTQAFKLGRGVSNNADGRFEQLQHIPAVPQWPGDLHETDNKTTITFEKAKRIISYNQSPDVPFDRSINPYHGCEHGCVYCFARPSHAYHGLSPGLDFERKLFAKQNAAELLRDELNAKNYRPATIAIGVNTDAYQPIERKLGITRRILEVLEESRHPLAIVSKSALIQRDIDILSSLARQGLVHVYISLTSLDNSLSRHMEPRASSPKRRLETIAALHENGIPVGVMLAPMIPAINTDELEAMLQAAKNAGAEQASYVLLRLPRELKDIFTHWLAENFPLRQERVLQYIREMREGKLYNNAFGTRMSGSGPYAEMLAQRFRLQCKKLGLNERTEELRTDIFRKSASPQMSLF